LSAVFHAYMQHTTTHLSIVRHSISSDLRSKHKKLDQVVAKEKKIEAEEERRFKESRIGEDDFSRILTSLLFVTRTHTIQYV